MPETPPVCTNCDRNRNGMQYIGDKPYCPYCVGWCPQCTGPMEFARMRYIANDYYCLNHSPECYQCNTPLANEWYTWNGELMCASCVPHCTDCNGIVDEDDYLDDEDGYLCSSCSRGDLSGYGRTHPTMWLGGPLPKTDDNRLEGYYIGFELEVYAERTTRLRPIREWAEKHLTDRAALDLKEDSSVRGFEIATQPMTPEFFESVNWDSFFLMLNRTIPLPRHLTDEPEDHGLHIHIGKVAFKGDDVALAAFAYLLGSDDQHMVRIGRREPTHYCEKTKKPVSEAIVSSRRGTAQAYKLERQGVYLNRGAINLANHNTVEIRAPKSTRSADELRSTVRMVYLAADYIRSLRFTNNGFIPPKALHWDAFTEWVEANHPDKVLP